MRSILSFRTALHIATACISMSLFAQMPSFLVPTVINIASKPDEFFLSIQSDCEEITPALHGRWQIHTALFWDLTTMVNMGLKVRIVDEGEYFPAITLAASGWDLVIMHFGSLVGARGAAWGVTPAITVSKTAFPGVTAYGGFKYAVGMVSVDIAGSSLTNQIPFFPVTGLQSLYQVPTLYAGVVQSLGADNDLIIVGGYMFGKWQPYAGLIFALPNWDLGLMFYPEAPLVVHPYINLHFRF